MGVSIGGERCNQQSVYTQISAQPFCSRRSRQISTAIGASSQSPGHIKPAATYNQHIRCGRGTLKARYTDCSRPNSLCCSASTSSLTHDIALDGSRAANSANNLNLDGVLNILAHLVGKVVLYSALLKLAGRTLAPTLSAAYFRMSSAHLLLDSYDFDWARQHLLPMALNATVIYCALLLRPYR